MALPRQASAQSSTDPPSGQRRTFRISLEEVYHTGFTACNRFRPSLCKLGRLAEGRVPDLFSARSLVKYRRALTKFAPSGSGSGVSPHLQHILEDLPAGHSLAPQRFHQALRTANDLRFQNSSSDTISKPAGVLKRLRFLRRRVPCEQTGPAFGFCNVRKRSGSWRILAERNTKRLSFPQRRVAVRTRWSSNVSPTPAIPPALRRRENRRKSSRPSGEALQPEWPEPQRGHRCPSDPRTSA